jgi:hypothetical protein
MTTQYCELHSNRPKFTLFPIVFQGKMQIALLRLIFNRKSEGSSYMLETRWRRWHHQQRINRLASRTQYWGSRVRHLFSPRPSLALSHKLVLATWASIMGNEV